jgi:hypothetical protein
MKERGMFGKLTWHAIPWDQPIPLFAAAFVGLALVAVFIWVVLKGPPAIPVARVDHERRS